MYLFQKNKKSAKKEFNSYITLVRRRPKLNITSREALNSIVKRNNMILFNNHKTFLTFISRVSKAGFLKNVCPGLDNQSSAHAIKNSDKIDQMDMFKH